MTTPRHILIIGAGPGGLCAGMLLSHCGFKVTLFDKHAEPGGRNRALRLGDFTFDTGPTFLLMKGVLDEVFELCGRRSEDYLEFLPLSPMYRLLFDDRDLSVYSEPAAMREELQRVFGDAAHFEHFLRQERRRFNALYPCMTRDYSRLQAFLSRDLLKALPWLAYPKSVFQNLGQYFQSEKMRLAFCFQSKYLGMSPWECPALFTMLSYLEHDYGIYHVRGGLNRISQAMAQVIAEQGGMLRLNSEVASLIIENRAVKGVVLQNGERVAGDAVVINADFAHAMTHLVQPGILRKYSAERLAKRQYSCSTFMLYLGLKRRYDLPHHTIVFAKNYHGNLDDIFQHKTLSEDISFYVHNPSLSDPTLAPSGKSALYVLVPMPNNDSGLDWLTHCQKVRDKVLDRLRERLGLSDLREQIECERLLTPHDWANDESVYKGATFSLAHHFSQMLYWRPHNRFEELDNCYLVGGGTHPGSGLPTIYESACISSRLIAKRYRVPAMLTPPRRWLKRA